MTKRRSTAFTLRQAAAELSCQPAVLQAAIHAGAIEAEYVGGLDGYLIRQESVRLWQEARTLDLPAKGESETVVVKGKLRKATRRTDAADASLSPDLLAGVLGLTAGAPLSR